MVSNHRWCGTYWGSHGCSKDAGHIRAGDPVHRCGSGSLDDDEDDLCSEMMTVYPESVDGPNAAVRYCVGEDVGPPWAWTEWLPSRWFT